MHVLILDLTHGGDILSEEYLSRGDAVTCVDVYHIATDEAKRDLISKGARVCDTTPPEDYDLLVSPAHCPDEFIGDATFAKRMTFSQAVNGFMRDERFRIEVTGVKGKTSSCYLLAHILSNAGKSVFLHTSRGQGPWISGGHRIDRKMSIAPTSLLRLPDGKYDCMVTEVSLGGSGRADIAVITNLTEDYGIARNTRKASDAKADVLCHGVNIVKDDELSIWMGYGERELVTYGGSVRVLDRPSLGRPMRLSFVYSTDERIVRHNVTMRDDYLSLQYIPSIELVLKVCETMRIPLWAVIKGLESFRGVPGRGEISFNDGIWYIRDRNPGISHISMDMTLKCLKEMDALDDAVAVVDPVSKKVCDKMDIGLMREVASGYGIPIILTDGCGSRPEIPEGTRIVIEFVKEGFQ